MSIVYNGTTVEKVIYNGTEVEKVIYNGTTVFEAGYRRTEEYNYQSSYSYDDLYPVPTNKTCYYTITFTIYNANTGTTTKTKTGSISYGEDAPSISEGTGAVYMDGEYYSTAAAVGLRYYYGAVSTYPYDDYPLVRIFPGSGTANNDKLRIWSSKIEIEIR